MKDYRSPEAAEYRKLYKGRAWRDGRAAHLAANPLCVLCLDDDVVTAATVVDHRIPHRGDLALFWDRGNWRSVCKPHHDGPIQREDHAGFSGAVNAAGYPTDPRHRANRTAR